MSTMINWTTCRESDKADSSEVHKTISIAGLPKERNAEILWKERAGRRLFATPHMLSSDMVRPNFILRGA